MNRTLDAQLTDLATWQARLEAGALGYPGRTAESRIGEGRADLPRHGGRVPQCLVPDRLKPLDRAIRDLPPREALAVRLRYFEGLDAERQAAEWAKRTRKSRRAFFHALDLSHTFVAGWLCRDGTG